MLNANITALLTNTINLIDHMIADGASTRTDIHNELARIKGANVTTENMRDLVFYATDLATLIVSLPENASITTWQLAVTDICIERSKLGCSWPTTGWTGC